MRCCAFLVRQLRAIVARIDILRGARPSFADEAFALFGVRVPVAADTTRLRSIRATLDRLLPGRGDLSARFTAFDRRFLVPAKRLPLVLARALERCRADAGLGLMGVAKDNYPRDGDTYSFVIGFAEVEVDVQTGHARR